MYNGGTNRRPGPEKANGHFLGQHRDVFIIFIISTYVHSNSVWLNSLGSKRKRESHWSVGY